MAITLPWKCSRFYRHGELKGAIKIDGQKKMWFQKTGSHSWEGGWDVTLDLATGILTSGIDFDYQGDSYHYDGISGTLTQTTGAGNMHVKNSAQKANVSWSADSASNMP